jgi:hypothetical protein
VEQKPDDGARAPTILNHVSGVGHPRTRVLVHTEPALASKGAR